MDEYKLPENKNTEKPVWVLQRQPMPEKGETYIQIWFKDDALEVSPNRLAEMLGKIMQGSVRKTK